MQQLVDEPPRHRFDDVRRVLATPQELGARIAELIEMPVMLSAMIAAAVWIVRRPFAAAEGRHPVRALVGCKIIDAA